MRRHEIEGISRREADGISEDKICRGRATKKSSLLRFFCSAKFLRFVLTLTIFLATMAVASWLVLNPILRSLMQTAAEDTLAGSVTVKEAGIDFFGYGVWGKDIVVASPPGFREPHVVRIGRVEIKTSPISWLAGSVDIDSIEAWDVDLRIEIREEGTNTSFLGKEGQPAEQDRALLLGKCVFHNSSIIIADKKNSTRIAFTDATVEFDDASLFKGTGHATNLRAECLIKSENCNANLKLNGTFGPIGDSVNFDLKVDVKRFDLRDFEPYVGSNLSKIFGSPLVNIKGPLVCKKNMLDGTKLFVRSSTGEFYPIHLAGPMDNPRLTKGAAIANAINFPFQKIFRFLFRKSSASHAR